MDSHTATLSSPCTMPPLHYDHVDLTRVDEDDIPEPAPDEAASEQSTTLLKEIFNLRHRLKELEEDGKSVYTDYTTGSSSMVNAASGNNESALVLLLKKELAKVENEKASIEKDFMNQLSNMARDYSMRLEQAQLQYERSEDNVKTLQARLFMHSDGGESNDAKQADRLHQLLKEEQQRHFDQVMQLNANIASADEEIAESRREMDMLHEDLQAQREEFTAALETCRAELENERQINEAYRVQLKTFSVEQHQHHRQSDASSASTDISSSASSAGNTFAVDSQTEHSAISSKHHHLELEQTVKSLREEIGEMNDTIIDLEKRKDSLVKEMQTLKREVAEKTEENKQQQLDYNEQIDDLQTRLREKENQFVSFRLKVDFDNVELQKKINEKEQNLQDEIDELHAQLQEKFAQVEQLQNLLDERSTSANGDSTRDLITPEEKELLESAVTALEERLVAFHTKLLEKDEMLEKLRKTLSEEKRLKKKLKSELLMAKAALNNQTGENTPTTSGMSTASEDSGSNNYDNNANYNKPPTIIRRSSMSEVEFLKKQNKILNDEVKALRSNLPMRSLSEHGAATFSSYPPELPSISSNSKDIEPKTPPPSSKKSILMSDDAPRTPVLGLVASFEKRMNSPKPPMNNKKLPSDDTERLQTEIRQLQDALMAEQETVCQLRDQVTSLSCISEHGDKSNNSATSFSFHLEQEVEDLKSQLQISQQCLQEMEETENADLQEIRNALEETKINVRELTMQLKHSQAELEEQERRVKLLSETNEELESQHDELKKQAMTSCDDMQRMTIAVKEFEHQKSALEDKMQQQTTEIERLKETTQEYENVVNELEEVVKEKNACIEHLTKELSAMQSEAEMEEEKKEDEKSGEIRRLHVELDQLQVDLEQTLTELEEAQTLNESLQKALCEEQNNSKETKMQLAELTEELFLLQEVKSQDDEVNKSQEIEMQNLQERLVTTQMSNAELEQEFMSRRKDLDTEIKSLKQQLEEITRDRDRRIAELEDNVNEKEERLQALQPQLDQAMREVADMKLSNETLRKAMQSERAAAVEACEKLEEAERRYDELENRKFDADKEKIMEMKSSESEIHNLRLQLTSVQIDKGDIENGLLLKIKDLESQLKCLRQQTESILEEKDAELDEMKAQLTRKEDEVKEMEREKTQLCANISNVSSHRKEEFEDLQAELIDMTAKVATQSREIQSLRGTIEDYEARKGGSEARLKDRITTLEEELGNTKAKFSSIGEFDTISNENKRLREVIRNLKLEKRSLKDRLNSIVTDKSSSKSAQVLRERNAALKLEVEKLTKRLKRVNTNVTRFAI